MIKIPISIDLRHFFVIAINLIQVIARLRRKEIQVLSALMLIDFTNRLQMKNKGIANEKIDAVMDKFFLSKDTRKKIRQGLNPPLSENSFNNQICRLRKKKMLTGNRINKYLLNLYPQQKDGKMHLDILFKLSTK